MVNIRNLTGLLLALAAAPSVLSTPVGIGNNGLVARVAEPQNLLNSLLGGDESTSASGGNGGSVSNSPSASPTNSPTSPSATPTRVTPSATPTNSPSATTPSNSPSRTSEPAQQTSTPAQITSIPAITSVAQARTTVQASGTQSQFVIVDVVYSTTGGLVTSAATQALAESTETPQPTPAANSSGSGSGDPNLAKKVGGGVGGAAGLILIVGLIAVAWRIWGKNRNKHEEDDALMSDGVYGTSEVKATSGPSTGSSPFQNNLEQYHNGRTNPSANF